MRNRFAKPYRCRGSASVGAGGVGPACVLEAGAIFSFGCIRTNPEPSALSEMRLAVHRTSSKAATHACEICISRRPHPELTSSPVTRRRFDFLRPCYSSFEYQLERGMLRVLLRRRCSAVLTAHRVRFCSKESERVVSVAFLLVHAAERPLLCSRRL